MRYLLLLSLTVFFWACPSPSAPTAEDAEPDPADTTTVDSEYLLRPGHGFGNIRAGMSTAELRAMLDTTEVVAQEFYLGEGYFEPGLLLYPGTRQELEVHLVNDTVNLIQITQDSSAWQTADHISVGSTLPEVVAANGGDFELMGFEWDYGGTVTDWQEGNFANKDLLMRFTITFGETHLPGEEVRAIMGDQVISSAHPVLAQYEVTVIEITQRRP